MIITASFADTWPGDLFAVLTPELQDCLCARLCAPADLSERFPDLDLETPRFLAANPFVVVVSCRHPAGTAGYVAPGTLFFVPKDADVVITQHFSSNTGPLAQPEPNRA